MVRETERQTVRDRDRQIETDRDRQRQTLERDRQRQIERDRQMNSVQFHGLPSCSLYQTSRQWRPNSDTHIDFPLLFLAS